MNKKIMMVAFTGMMLHCGVSFGMFSILDGFIKKNLLAKVAIQDGSGESNNLNIDASDEEALTPLLTSPLSCKKKVILKNPVTMAIRDPNGRTFNLNVEKFSTILELKKELYKMKNKKEPSSLADYQKLKLYFGGLLDDKKTLDYYGGNECFSRSNFHYKTRLYY